MKLPLESALRCLQLFSLVRFGSLVGVVRDFLVVRTRLLRNKAKSILRVRRLGASQKFPKEETAMDSASVSEPVSEVSFVFVIVYKVVVQDGVPLFDELGTPAFEPVGFGGDLVVVLRGSNRFVHSLVIILSTQFLIVFF